MRRRLWVAEILVWVVGSCFLSWNLALPPRIVIYREQDLSVRPAVVLSERESHWPDAGSHREIGYRDGWYGPGGGPFTHYGDSITRVEWSRWWWWNGATAVGTIIVGLGLRRMRRGM